MYKLELFVIVLICVAATRYGEAEAEAAAASSDYCDPRLCTDYQGKVSKHIGCNNNGSFHARCSADAKILPITSELKSLILNGFNDLRNKIASGAIPDYQPAADMPQIQWDDELANLAELNVKQCTMKHDKCHNTDKYAWSGQSLGYSWTTAKDIDVKAAFSAQIKGWFDECNDCDQSVINKFRGSDTGVQWTHFTVMVNHKTDRVGCAASQYVAGTSAGYKATYILMACNFSYTNLQGEPVYVMGEPCTKCRTGCSKEYPALCSTSEVVKYLPDVLLKLQ